MNQHKKNVLKYQKLKILKKILLKAKIYQNVNHKIFNPNIISQAKLFKVLKIAIKYTQKYKIFLF